MPSCAITKKKKKSSWMIFATSRNPQAQTLAALCQTPFESRSWNCESVQTVIAVTASYLAHTSRSNLPHFYPLAALIVTLSLVLSFSLSFSLFRAYRRGPSSRLFSSARCGSIVQSIMYTLGAPRVHILRISAPGVEEKWKGVEIRCSHPRVSMR